MLLQNDYKDVLDKNGKVKYRIKECVDDFHYVITDPATGRKNTVKGLFICRKTKQLPGIF
ncbi:hypothetical protein DW268_14065 [Agathobacter rectalis]|nr:hypothetical protein DW268_14065 [Agathobacter rectalis]